MVPRNSGFASAIWYKLLHRVDVTDRLLELLFSLDGEACSANIEPDCALSYPRCAHDGSLGYVYHYPAWNAGGGVPFPLLL